MDSADSPSALASAVPANLSAVLSPRDIDTMNVDGHGT